MPQQCRTNAHTSSPQKRSGMGKFVLIKFIHMNQPLLGTRIAELRNQKGITQKELADACQIDIRTIQRIEAGKVLPRMYTIRLLAVALGTEISYFNGDTIQSVHVGASRQLKWALIAAFIFSLNYIPVVLNIVTLAPDSIVKNIFLIIHMISCVFFFRGFYWLGKQNGNQTLAISAVLSMILLPLLSVINLMQGILFFDTTNAAVIFIVACVNAILLGISLLNEAGKRLPANNLYRITGYTTLLQSALFLTGSFPLVVAGLIISVFCNFMMTMILFKESRHEQSQAEEGSVRSIMS
jgi:transcriptional regulator with XRE-family HTH domain